MCQLRYGYMRTHDNCQNHEFNLRLIYFNFLEKLQPRRSYKITSRGVFGTLPNIERFAEIANSFKLLTIFVRNSIINV